ATAIAFPAACCRVFNGKSRLQNAYNCSLPGDKPIQPRRCDMKKKWVVNVMIFGVVLFLLVLTSQAFSATPYYEGKTIRIIVGFKPGGGYDRLARLMAKHLPKHIPGQPTVIVENMEGASSIIAANHVFNIAKPDGLTIVAFNRGIPFAQLTNVEGVKFDIAKFSWIGSAAVEATVLCIRNDLPYKTFADLQKVKESIPLAGMGPGTSDTQFALLAKEFLGVNLKLIIYPSSSDAMLAIERKEVDGRGGSYSSLKPFIDRGLVRPVLRGAVSEPGIENLPVNEDLATNPTGKVIMGMLASTDRIGRPYVAPPGTSPELMNILRDAFAKVSNDPEAKKDAKKNKMQITYVPVEDVTKTLNYLMNQPADIVKEFAKYIKF
ncbi:MAG: tripartite tricarboxylate transporter substrate-binding protein, partial [bacterium]|nr:tripartite tricarboxylate transporter substrate-binding protein [bacterium]